LASAIERYIAEVSSKKKGHRSEQSIARIWLGTRLASRPVDRIQSVDLAALRDEWLKTKASATVVRRLAFLSHVYTVLRKDWGHATLANPAQLVRRPSVADARERRLFEHIRLRGISQAECPRDELTWIIRHTRSPVLPTIASLAVETAIRRGEICSLQRQHVDLLRGVAKLFDTKNGTAREVPLSPVAKDALRRFLEGKPLRGRIFKTSPGAVTRAFIRARKRARAAYEGLCKKHGRQALPMYFHDLRFHDLRHEATSRLSTVFQLADMAKVSGHSDTRMLLRYYHPRGWELARKLARSPLGRKQLEWLRETEAA
jgi:integrase